MGGLTVEIRPGAHDYARGAEAQLTVILRGGIVRQRVGSVSIKLEDFWGTRNKAQFRTRHSRVLASDLLVLPHSRHEFTFAFQIPDDMRLSQTGSEGGLTAGGRVSVCANPCGSLAFPRDRAFFGVGPHREVEAVHAAMERVGFQEASPLPALVHGVAKFFGLPVDVLTAFGQPDGTYVRHYQPAESLTELYSRATLYLHVHNERVFGMLWLDRRPHALPPHAECLLASMRERFTFRIPCRKLLNLSGDLQPEGAKEHLARIMQEARILPGDPRYRLLRPASSPDEPADTLLRPAAHAPTTAREMLLRPIDPPKPGGTEADQEH